MKILMFLIVSLLVAASPSHAARKCVDLYRSLQSEAYANEILIQHLRMAQKFPLLFNEFDPILVQLKSDFSKDTFVYTSSDGNPIIFVFKTANGERVVVDSARAASHGEGVKLRFDLENQKIEVLEGRTWGGVKVPEGGELVEVSHRF